MRLPRENHNSSRTMKISLVSKVAVPFIAALLLLSYCGYITGSLCHVIAGIAVVFGVSLLKGSFITSKTDSSN